MSEHAIHGSLLNCILTENFSRDLLHRYQYCFLTSNTVAFAESFFIHLNPKIFSSNFLLQPAETQNVSHTQIACKVTTYICTTECTGKSEVLSVLWVKDSIICLSVRFLVLKYSIVPLS